MRKVYYNKLIRDKIPERITESDGDYEIREIKDDEEYIQELLKKVSEEASALSEVRSKEEFISEYADLMEVLNTLSRELEIADDELENALQENTEKKGGYEKRYFLHWSSDTGYKSNETIQGIRDKS